MFISFEGGEGAGKTTQIQLLADKLSASGNDVILTREPGGTPEAEKIRELLVRRDGGNWTPTAEAMLFFTARHMHWVNKIEPHLRTGGVVITDRFTDSTIAYQGYGHRFDKDKLYAIKAMAIGDVEPDVTFILDIPVVDGLARAGKRMEGDDNNATEDRFERISTDFHERLRQGYLEIAADNPKRCVVIDARQSIDNIHAEILKHLKAL